VFYAYILLSSKSHLFYFGSTKDLRLRFEAPLRSLGEYRVGVPIGGMRHVMGSRVCYYSVVNVGD